MKEKTTGNTCNGLKTHERPVERHRLLRNVEKVISELGDSLPDRVFDVLTSNVVVHPRLMLR